MALNFKYLFDIKKLFSVITTNNLFVIPQGVAPLRKDKYFSALVHKDYSTLHSCSSFVSVHDYKFYKHLMKLIRILLESSICSLFYHKCTWKYLIDEPQPIQQSIVPD